MTHTANLGPASWRMLQAAGVPGLAALQQLGAVAAYLQVKRSGQPEPAVGAGRRTERA